MKRLSHLAIGGLFLLLPVTWAGCDRSAEPTFDNLVLVTIDTLRADHLGSYGYPRSVSPFLDSVAAKGVRFDRAISSSSHTGPSHASMFTSQYPARHRVNRNGVRLRPAVPTLAGMLRESGFDTAGFVSIGFLATVAQGFETAPKRRRQGYKPANVMVDTALEWLAARSEKRRFFLWVHFFDVHNSRRDAAMPEPHFARMKADSSARGGGLGDMLLAHSGTPASAIEEHGDQFDRYDSQIAFVDSQLERLFESIETQTSAERTLWIITADHGEGLGNHDYWGHSKFLYREQIRVPLIFYGGQDWHSGRVVDSLVRHVDLLPTAAELLQIPLDREALQLEGVSLKGFLEGSGARSPIDLAVAQRRPTDKSPLRAGWEPGLVLAAQNERFKYILHSDGEDELYDLEADPFETTNLIGRGLETEKKLAGWLTQKYEWMRAHPLVGTPAEPSIDAEFIEELKSLGYLN